MNGPTASADTTQTALDVVLSESSLRDLEPSPPAKAANLVTGLIHRMTWYLTDRREYIARGREIGQAYREVLGREFGIAMTAVQVAGLVEERAKVEIEVTAVLPA